MKYQGSICVGSQPMWRGVNMYALSHWLSTYQNDPWILQNILVFNCEVEICWGDFVSALIFASTASHVFLVHIIHNCASHWKWKYHILTWVIGIDTNIEVIVVLLTTWEAHHSPRAKPEGCGELPRSLMRQQWPKLRYQFLFYHDETKLMMNKQILSI